MKGKLTSNRRIVSEIGRIYRFVLVGLLSTAVYLFISLAMVEAIHMPPVNASITGQLAGAAVSFFGHGLYSFKVAQLSMGYFRRFIVVMLATLSTNIVVIWLLVDGLQLSHQLSFLLVGGVIMTVNYLCNRYWVFLLGIHSAAEQKQ